jgi:flavin-dependent dehydrogenase
LAYVDISRSLFDSEINKMAVKEGATIYLNAGVKEIKVSDQAFIVTLNTGGEKMEFNARVGVIATGFELHALQGLGKRHANCFFGIQADVKMENLGDVEVYFGEKIAPGSFGWVVPTNGKSAKVGLIAKKNPAEFLKSFLMNPLVADRMNPCENKIKCSPIPVKRISKSSERLSLLGRGCRAGRLQRAGDLLRLLC